MPRPIPTPKPSIEQLQRTYRAGVLEILGRLEFLVSRGRSEAHARAALREAKEVLSELDEYADSWIEQNVPVAYREGWDQGLDSTLYATPEAVKAAVQYADFARLHRQAIEVVAYNMQESVKAATATMGRRMDDVFRRIGLEETQRRLFTGEAIRDTAGRMKERLVLSGMDSFKDKAGRVWRLDNYCTMVARTTTREATTLGTLNRASAGGYELLVVSEHEPTCELCIGIGGKVFSLNGGDRRYPRWNGEVPRHANCLHVVSVYIERYDSQAEWRREHSNTPLDVDTRTDAQKKAYDAIQAGNRKQNELRRQYERYRARLGDEAGTIQGFARSKRADSERWYELQEMYREAGRQ